MTRFLHHRRQAILACVTACLCAAACTTGTGQPAQRTGRSASPQSAPQPPATPAPDASTAPQTVPPVATAGDPAPPSDLAAWAAGINPRPNQPVALPDPPESPNPPPPHPQPSVADSGNTAWQQAIAPPAPSATPAPSSTADPNGPTGPAEPQPSAQPSADPQPDPRIAPLPPPQRPDLAILIDGKPAQPAYGGTTSRWSLEQSVSQDPALSFSLSEASKSGYVRADWLFQRLDAPVAEIILLTERSEHGFEPGKARRLSDLPGGVIAVGPAGLPLSRPTLRAGTHYLARIRVDCYGHTHHATVLFRTAD